MKRTERRVQVGICHDGQPHDVRDIHTISSDGVREEGTCHKCRGLINARGPGFRGMYIPTVAQLAEETRRKYHNTPWHLEKQRELEMASGVPAKLIIHRRIFTHG